MGRWTLKRQRRESASAVPLRTSSPVAKEWFDDVLDNARTQGSLPYLVEGYPEVMEAVRRGHAVLVRRVPCQVTETIAIFDDQYSTDDAVVTVIRFDVRTARYVVTDPYTAVGALELTPKRLERYLDHPQRSIGVALGA